MSHRPMCQLVAAPTLLALVTVLPARAELATPVETRRVATNWLTAVVRQHGDWAGTRTPAVVGVEAIIGRNGPLAHCYRVAPRGYVVIPLLKELPPVRAYSAASDLDVNAAGGMTQLLRDVLEHRFDMYTTRFGSPNAPQIAGREVFPAVYRQQWNTLAVDPSEFEQLLRSRPPTSRGVVGPLLSSTWDQYPPYNDFCPMGDGGRCIVGCVATATAQTMWYYRWPPTGVGGASYYWYGDNSCGGSTAGQHLSASFTDEYDWANMPANCRVASPPEQRDAVAELCYEVGVAFAMDYGYCASGAYTGDAVWVLRSYYRYHSGIDREDRYQHSAASWFAIIQTELDAGRVMIYRIHRHAIVCDGYDDTGGLQLYHMNYGWDDSHTAWYVLDETYCTWEGCDPMVEYMIRRIAPNVDCNGNGNPDFSDIGEGISQDCNVTSIPDECETIGAGDFNGDSVVDADDFTWFGTLMGGPDLEPVGGAPECNDTYLAAFDLDGDDDIDLPDFAAFQLVVGVR